MNTVNDIMWKVWILFCLKILFFLFPLNNQFSSQNSNCRSLSPQQCTVSSLNFGLDLSAFTELLGRCPTWISGLSRVRAQSMKLLFSGSIPGVYARSFSSTYKHKLSRACSYTELCVWFFKPVRPTCFHFGLSQPPLSETSMFDSPLNSICSYLPSKAFRWFSLNFVHSLYCFLQKDVCDRAY